MSPSLPQRHRFKGLLFFLTLADIAGTGERVFLPSEDYKGWLKRLQEICQDGTHLPLECCQAAFCDESTSDEFFVHRKGKDEDCQSNKNYICYICPPNTEGDVPTVQAKGSHTKAHSLQLWPMLMLTSVAAVETICVLLCVAVLLIISFWGLKGRKRNNSYRQPEEAYVGFKVDQIKASNEGSTRHDDSVRSERPMLQLSKTCNIFKYTMLVEPVIDCFSEIDYFNLSSEKVMKHKPDNNIIEYKSEIEENNISKEYSLSAPRSYFCTCNNAHKQLNLIKIGRLCSCYDFYKASRNYISIQSDSNSQETENVLPGLETQCNENVNCSETFVKHDFARTGRYLAPKQPEKEQKQGRCLQHAVDSAFKSNSTGNLIFSGADVNLINPNQKGSTGDRTTKAYKDGGENQAGFKQEEYQNNKGEKTDYTKSKAYCFRLSAQQKNLGEDDQTTCNLKIRGTKEDSVSHFAMSEKAFKARRSTGEAGMKFRDQNIFATTEFFRTIKKQPPYLRWHDCSAISTEPIIVYMNEIGNSDTHTFQKDSQASVTNLTPRDALRSEIFRYGTFINFPPSPAWPNRLAAAGFYYCGNGDEAVCFSCHVTYRGWRQHDSPVEVHRRISPSCRFLNQQEENIPVQTDSIARQRLIELSGGTDILSQTGSSQTEATAACAAPFLFANTLQANCAVSSSAEATVVREHSQERWTAVSGVGSTFPRHDHSLLAHTLTPVTQQVTSDGVASPVRNDDLISTQRENSTYFMSTEIGGHTLGINIDRPKHPEYAVSAVRLSSFCGWPSSHAQRPQQLAEAGFYYVGNSDRVRCFFCGGGLRNWDEEDNIWIEHARWFPECAYVRQTKGENFVRLIQEMNTNNEQIDYDQVMSIVSDTISQRSTSPHTSHSPPSASKPGLPTQLGMTVATGPRHSFEKNNEDNSSTPKSTSGVSTTAASGEPRMESEVDADSLMEENERLKQQTTCKICLDKDSCIVFLPCGHLCSCAECAPALRKCPMCRTPVRGSVRVYMG